MEKSPLILMASLGSEFAEPSLKQAAKFAKSLDKSHPAKNSDAVNARPIIHLFTIARIYGSAFGLPNPGLMPNKQEWKQQYDLLAAAQKSLKKSGIESSALVVSSRNPTKRIIAEAKHIKATHLLIETPPKKHWLIAHLFWEQQAFTIIKKAKKLGLDVVILNG